ncbi:hypothetical protein [Streptomonospora mangrovi]|nr:hypothetical protein [Streptomonospora mangrovi]
MEPNWWMLPVALWTATAVWWGLSRLAHDRRNRVPAADRRPAA